MKLSVLFITYNHERFIARALESVLSQRVNFDYEIVIGEDCSTDGTRAIIADFHRRYPDRIVPILRDRNIGGAGNFASTQAACRGQYMAILEGDDYWNCADKLQRQVDFLDTHPDYAICCHRVRVLDELGSGLPDTLPSRPAGVYAIEDLFDHNWIMTGSVMYRWGSLATLPTWFTEMRVGDWPLNVLMARFGKIHLMDEVMAAYRLHVGGVWASMPSISQHQEIVRMLAALDEHLQFKYSRAIRRRSARSYLDLAFLARTDRNRRQTARYLLACLRNRGWQLHGRRRDLAGIAAYILIGSWYKVFSRAKSGSSGCHRSESPSLPLL